MLLLSDVHVRTTSRDNCKLGSMEAYSNGRVCSRTCVVIEIHQHKHIMIEYAYYTADQCSAIFLYVCTYM